MQRGCVLGGGEEEEEEKGTCLAELPPRTHPRPPTGGGRRIHNEDPKLAGASGSYQLSGVSWVSMSTLQMGHFLLVASH